MINKKKDRPSILIVDDERGTREALGRFLRMDSVFELILKFFLFRLPVFVACALPLPYRLILFPVCSNVSFFLKPLTLRWESGIIWVTLKR